MPRRKLDFTTFDALIADVETLHARGYTRAGNWSLEQAAEHLTLFMRCSLEGFPDKNDGLKFKLARLFGRMIYNRMVKTRSIPAGFKGPDEFMPGPKSDPAAVAVLQDMCRRVRDHAGAFHPSPVFGKLTNPEWKQAHLIHAAHHLRFLTPNF
jgi:hypothetical protein